MEECKDGNNDETMIGRIIIIMMMRYDVLLRSCSDSIRDEHRERNIIAS